MKLTYTEFTAYSPLEDEQQVRLSCFHRGAEYFALLTAGGKWRDRRTAALDYLAMIIANDEPPGDYTNDVRREMGEPLLEGVCE